MIFLTGLMFQKPFRVLKIKNTQKDIAAKFWEIWNSLSNEFGEKCGGRIFKGNVTEASP